MHGCRWPPALLHLERRGLRLDHRVATRLGSHAVDVREALRLKVGGAVLVHHPGSAQGKCPGGKGVQSKSDTRRGRACECAVTIGKSRHPIRDVRVREDGASAKQRHDRKYRETKHLLHGGVGRSERWRREQRRNGGTVFAEQGSNRYFQAPFPATTHPMRRIETLLLLLATAAPLPAQLAQLAGRPVTVSYTHLRAHETPEHLVCRL